VGQGLSYFPPKNPSRTCRGAKWSNTTGKASLSQHFEGGFGQ